MARSEQDGFTLIELLIAMTITVLIAGVVASVAPPAREAFDRVPAELDLQQRGRTAIDALSQALRSSGKNVAATELLGSLSGLLPTASVSEPDESGAFTELTVIVPVRDAAQGCCQRIKPGPAAADHSRDRHIVPNVKDVCGFTPGSTAVIADGAGHYDVLPIASTDAGARRMTPDARAVAIVSGGIGGRRGRSIHVQSGGAGRRQSLTDSRNLLPAPSSRSWIS